MNALLDREAHHLRITWPLELAQVEEFVSSLTDVYIVCNEITHSHSYVQTDLTKPEIYARLAVWLPELPPGNTAKSCTPVRTKRQMAKYVLKDGHFAYKGIDSKVIAALYKSSVKKYGEEYETSKAVLEDKFLLSTVTCIRGLLRDWKIFIQDMIVLRSEYGNVRKNDLEGYFNRMLVRKSPNLGSKYLTDQWFRIDAYLQFN